MSGEEFEDLIEKYRTETASAIENEAMERLSEVLDADEEKFLKSLSLIKLSNEYGKDEIKLRFVKALFSRLGVVRSSLVGLGGGIIVSKIDYSPEKDKLILTLSLDGACIACGAAPGTLIGIRKDLEVDPEIENVKFSKELLESFGELGKEFLLTQTNLEFV